MAQKINQAAIAAAIKKRNKKNPACPFCVNGKIGKAKCNNCRGSGIVK